MVSNAKGTAKRPSMAELIAAERKKRGISSADEASSSSAVKKRKKQKQKQKPSVMPTARKHDSHLYDSSESEEDVDGVVAAVVGNVSIAPQLVKYTESRVGEGDGCVMMRSNITVHYTGRLATGTIFDSSKSKAPFRFTIGRDEVVEGFEDGVLGMKLGGERTIHVPPELGYGRDGCAACKIPPHAQLQFDVTLLGIS